MATDMPATTMVRSLAPSHTIQKRGQCRFRETVQYHQTWLQDPCDPSGAPEKYCGSYTQDHNKKETDKSFCQCHGNMCKQGLIPAHGKKGLCDQGRTAEDKGIDPSKIRGYFPKSHKQDKKKYPCSKDDVFFFFLLCKILFLLSGNFRHFH